jgi:acetyl esterase/lipase
MRRWLFIGVAVVAILLLGITARRYVHGFTLVVRAADLPGPIRRLADLDTVLISERIVRARVKDTSIRARVYAPVGIGHQTVLLVSGLHPAGIDEPRLVVLARRLAEANVVVVTPDIPELSRFEITPLLTDRIEEAAAWLATESGLAPTGRIGLMGISFSGGLAVVAAGRPSLRNHLSSVFSILSAPHGPDRSECNSHHRSATLPERTWATLFEQQRATDFRHRDAGSRRNCLPV